MQREGARYQPPSWQAPRSASIYVTAGLPTPLFGDDSEESNYQWKNIPEDARIPPVPSSYPSRPFDPRPHRDRGLAEMMANSSRHQDESQLARLSINRYNRRVNRRIVDPTMGSGESNRAGSERQFLGSINRQTLESTMATREPREAGFSSYYPQPVHAQTMDDTTGSRQLSRVGFNDTVVTPINGSSMGDAMETHQPNRAALDTATMTPITGQSNDDTTQLGQSSSAVRKNPFSHNRSGPPTPFPKHLLI